MDKDNYIDTAKQILTTRVKHTSVLICDNKDRVLKLWLHLRKKLIGLENCLYFDSQELKIIYYQNINYYKKFGGTYPSYSYIEEELAVLENLRKLRRKITHYSEKMNGKYIESFKQYLYTIKEILGC